MGWTLLVIVGVLVTTGFSSDGPGRPVTSELQVESAAGTEALLGKPAPPVERLAVADDAELVGTWRVFTDDSEAQPVYDIPFDPQGPVTVLYASAVPWRVVAWDYVVDGSSVVVTLNCQTEAGDGTLVTWVEMLTMQLSDGEMRGSWGGDFWEYTQEDGVTRGEFQVAAANAYARPVDAPDNPVPPPSTVAANAASGIIEQDGAIYLVPPPGGILELTSDDLPPEISQQLVTLGQHNVTAGPPDTIIEGDAQVLLDGLPLVRQGDHTMMGGEVIDGSTTIFINGVPAATVGGTVTNPLVIGMTPLSGGPILPRSSCPADGGRMSPCTPDDYPEPIDTLESDARVGDTRIVLVDDEDFGVGDTITIGGPGEDIEIRAVTDKGSLVLDRPLEFDHPAGATVVRLPAEYASTYQPASAEDDATVPDDSVLVDDGSEVITSAPDGSGGGPLLLIVAALGAAAAAVVVSVTVARRRADRGTAAV